MHREQQAVRDPLCRARREPEVDSPRSCSAARVCSIRWPNCTDDGHATSQPRHCTHSFIAASNASSMGRPSSSTSRIAAMRPRGDAISSPVTRYVGQCGRQSPHDTHATSSSASRCSGPAPSVIAGAVRARACRSGSNASFTRRISAAFGSGRPKPSRPSPPASRNIQPSCSWAMRRASASTERRRRRRARCRRRAPRTSARPGPRRVRAPIGFRAPAATEMRPRCAPVGRSAVRTRRDRPTARRRRPRRLRAGCTPADRPTASPRRESGRRLARSGTSCAERLGGRQRSVSCTSTPSVPNEPTNRRGQVVAGDVLDRRAAALHEPAVAGHEAHFEHVVAQRSVPQAADAREPARHDAADGRGGIARIERALLAVLRERGVELGERGAAPTVTVRSSGS